MSTLTPEQRAFARAMTPKQWNTLRVLADFHMYLSAIERGDPELYALIRAKLAVAGSGTLVGACDLPHWTATELGRSVIGMRDAGTL